VTGSQAISGAPDLRDSLDEEGQHRAELPHVRIAEVRRWSISGERDVRSAGLADLGLLVVWLSEIHNTVRVLLVAYGVDRCDEVWNAGWAP